MKKLDSIAIRESQRITLKFAFLIIPAVIDRGTVSIKEDGGKGSNCDLGWIRGRKGKESRSEL